LISQTGSDVHNIAVLGDSHFTHILVVIPNITKVTVTFDITDWIGCAQYRRL